MKQRIGLILSVTLLALVNVAVAVDCITNPQDHSCHDYQFPNSKATVDELCGMMSNMPACSIRDICAVPSLNSSRPQCTYFSLMADACTDMAMGSQGCANWTKMCYPSTGGASMVMECQTANLTSILPGYDDLETRVTQICSQNPQPNPFQCHKCANGADCQYLDVYSELCKSQTSLGQSPVCSSWKSMCSVIGSWNWPLCTNNVSPPSPINPTVIDCIHDNRNPSCKNYVYPNPQDVVKTMCDKMDTMPTCSVNKNVCSKSQYSSSKYCAPFSLMADVCTDMVMGVQGCMDYRSMCNASSIIDECQTPSLKSVLPTYSQASGYVKSICSEMSMDGCEKCTSGSCDYLSVYSDLCMAMPEMKQCDAWKSLCTIVSDWPYCPSSSNPHQMPMMKMYFHTGILDYVLFQGWVPRNKVQYAFTWLAVFVAGVLLEVIKFLRAKLEKKWIATRLMSLQEDFDSPSTSPAWNVWIDVPRAALQTLELAWGYLLMLVAMTFNVGLFFAVLAGCFVGTVVFGRFLMVLPRPRAGAASCH